MPNPLLARGLEALGKLATSKAARDKLVKLALDYGAKIAQGTWSDAQKAHAQRALAVELARQTEGGKLSYRTLLDGQPHTVVWADGEPIAAFPPWRGDLENALVRFRRELLEDPPEKRAADRRSPWRRSASNPGNSGGPEEPGAQPSGSSGDSGRAGAANAGSQLQTQIWVNKRPRELAEALGAVLPDLAEAKIE